MCYAVNVALHALIFITLVSITCAECGGKTAVCDLLNGTITLRHGSDTLYLPNTYCEWLIRGKPIKVFYRYALSSTMSRSHLTFATMTSTIYAKFPNVNMS